MRPWDAWLCIETLAKESGVNLSPMPVYNKERDTLEISIWEGQTIRHCEVSLLALENAHDRDGFIKRCVLRVPALKAVR